MLAIALAAAAIPSGDFAVPLPPKLDARTIEAFEKQGADRFLQTAEAMKGWSAEQVAIAIKGRLEDSTAIVYQRGHGVYVEYTGKDGEVRMWYPRNTRVLKGHWGVQDVAGLPKACFRYVEGVNPVTGVFAPTECVHPVQIVSRSVVLAERSGDVFGLLSGKVPYPKDPLDVPIPPR